MHSHDDKITITIGSCKAQRLTVATLKWLKCKTASPNANIWFYYQKCSGSYKDVEKNNKNKRKKVAGINKEIIFGSKY